MPGLVYVAGSHRNRTRLACDIASSVYGFGNTITGSIDHERYSLRVVTNKHTEPARLYSGTEWMIGYWGYPRYNGRELETEDIIREFEFSLSKGIEPALHNITGHYQMFIAGPSHADIYLINDKVGTHPWYFMQNDEFVIGTPDPFSMLAALPFGWITKINRNAITEFIGSGHLWGRETFCEGMHRLGPGEYVVINGGNLDIFSHWDLHHSPVNLTDIKRKELLKSALIRDIKLLPDNGTGVITLSGGVDSRALLALTSEAGKKVEAVTYTFGTGVLPDSDADIAGSIARRAGVPWEMIITDGANYVDNLLEIISATGGESDAPCGQEAFLGPDFYRRLRSRYSYLIRADEMWGWGNPARSQDEAFFINGMMNVDEFEHPKALLKKHEFERSRQYIKSLKNQIVREGTFVEQKRYDDLCEYIFWKNRGVRLHQNAAYFRRTIIPHHAPFLFDNTIESHSRLPASDRVDKRILRDIMRDMFPDLFSDDRQVVRNRAGYKYEYLIKNNVTVRDMIEDTLILKPPPEFEDMFDYKALNAWVYDILNDLDARYIAKGRKSYYAKYRINSILRKFEDIRHVMLSIARKTGSLKFPVVNANFIMRLTILGLSLKRYNSFIN